MEEDPAPAPPIPVAPPAPVPPVPPAPAIDNTLAPTLSEGVRFEHRGSLLYPVISRTVSNKDVWVLNLAELQRLNLQVMRNKLAKLAVVDLSLGIDDSLKANDTIELENVMHAYCKLKFPCLMIIPAASEQVQRPCAKYF